MQIEAIASAIAAVALAKALWITLSYVLGLVAHPETRVLVLGSASMDDVAARRTSLMMH